MKVSFTIDWHNYEDRNSLLGLLKASSYQTILADLDNMLRSKTKYAGDDVPGEVVQAYSEIRESLWGLCNENKVDPHEDG